MMNQEDLFKKIGLILNELNNQYDFLAQNPQQLNELELELFHANATFLADHVQILKKISLNQQPALEIAAPEPEKDDIQVEDLTIEIHPDIKAIEEEVFKLDNEPSTFEFILNEHSEHEKFDFEEKTVDEIFNRPLSQEEENILAQKRKLNNPALNDEIEADEDEIGPEPFLVSNAADEEIEDPSYKPTLNELLASKTDKSVNDHTGGVAISDLKQGINLNDKLIYIKDLFNGYNLAYAEAIDLANKMPNFEAADNFFKKNYAIKNNWAEKQATVDKFYALLNQRFK